jgi:steroid 5-alpha reductase family enzyme
MRWYREFIVEIWRTAADFGVVGLFSSVAMLFTWWWQRQTRNAGFVDITWAACLAFAALYFGAVGDGAVLPRMLVALLGAIWGFRLANHLLARVLGEAEDGRYAYLRTYWRDNQWKFFLMFQAQVILILVLAIPFYVAAHNPEPNWSWFYVAGLTLWVLSLGGETLADFQLARFRAANKHRGKTCRSGLWRFSRHPNYFFEWLHWFSYCLIAVGAPWAALTLLAPALMLVTLCFGTGIPFVEAQALRSRGEDYRDYQRTTSAFFPWFPKRLEASRSENTAAD